MTSTTSQQIRDDYVADLVETSGLDADQITIDSVDVTNGNTYTLRSTIRFSQQDTAAAETLRAQIENATVFTRLKTRGSVTSVPVRSQKTFGASEDKPRVYTTKKNASGAVTERLEVLRFATGRRLERLRNPVNESDVLETTDIGVPDSSGNYTRATLRKNGSRTIVKKRQNDDAVLETTEVSVPDGTNQSLWSTTYADGTVDYVRAAYSESLATAAVSMAVEITSLTFSSATGLTVSASVQADASATTSYYVLGALQPFASESQILAAITSATPLGTVNAGSSLDLTRTLSRIVDNTVTPSNPDYNSLLADQATVYVYAVPSGSSAYVLRFQTVAFSGPKRYLNVESAYLSRFDNTLHVTITVFAAGDTVSEVYPPVAFTPGTASLTDDAAVRAFVEANVVPDATTTYPANVESVVDGFAPIAEAYDGLAGDVVVPVGTDTRVRAVVKTDLGYTMVSPTFANVGFASSLEATIATAAFDSNDKTLSISGTVVPDATRATTYYAFATTHDPKLDPIPARDLALSTEPETAIAVTGNAGDLTDVTLPYVLDVTGKRHPSSAVNAATTYVYATDGVALHDALTTRSVPASDNLPHLRVRNFYWSRFYGRPTFEITAFSSWADIASVYTPVVFTSTVDLTDEAAVLAFVTSRSTLLESSGREMRAVLEMELYQVTDAYTALVGDPQPPTEPMVVDGMYYVVVAAVDVLGNTGLAILRGEQTVVVDNGGGGGTLSLRNVDWSQETTDYPDTDLSRKPDSYPFVGKYGISSAISGDGKTVLVSGNINSSLYVWTQDTNGSWSVTADLTQDSTVYPAIGYFCDLSYDGQMAVTVGKVSAYVSNALVFEKNADGTWGVPDASSSTGFRPNFNLSQTSTVSQNYGECCRISGDKKTIILSGSTSKIAGMIGVWEKAEDGTWGVPDASQSTGYRPNHKLSKSGQTGGYGYSSGISYDGRVIVTSGWNGSNFGVAYVWQKAEDGSWNDQQLIPSVQSTTGQFGWSCDVSGDGTVVVVTSAVQATYVWKKNGNSYGVEDAAYSTGFAPHAEITTMYLRACSLSYDGKMVVLGGTYKWDNGTVRLFKENDADGTWSSVANLSKLGSSVRGASGKYGNSIRLSIDNTTVVASGEYTDTASGCVWVWNGLDLGESGSISIGGDSGGGGGGNTTDAQSLTVPSDLNATLTSASFSPIDGTLTVSGEVIADASRSTTYRVYATTDPARTAKQVRDDVPADSEALTLGSAGVLSEVPVPRVVDVFGNVYPSAAVNRATVFLIGTDGVRSHDALATTEVLPDDNLPHMNLQRFYWSRLYRSASADITAFSSVANLTAIYRPLAFASSVDLSDAAALTTFVTTHGTVLEGATSDINGVWSREIHSMTEAYTNLDVVSAPTTETIVENGAYVVVLAAVDASERMGLVAIGGSEALDALSALNATLTSASFAADKTTLVVSGQVVPDATRPSAYYVLATTDPTMSADQVRASILSGSNAATVVVVTPEADDDTFVLDSVASVFDGAGVVRSVKAVNYAKVYVYGTDGVRSHDALAVSEILPTDTKPHVTLQHVVQTETGTIAVSCSAFSAYASLVSVRVLAVSTELDVQTDQAATATLVNTYGTDLGPVERYAVGVFDSVVFTDIVVSADGSTAAYTEGRNYRVVMVVTDADGGVSVSSALSAFPRDLAFDFTTDTRDATGAFEFVKHSAQGTMTFATDGSGLVFASGGQAEVDLGPEYFDPNGSFTLQFDYSTQMPSGDRLFVSTWSNESVGSTVMTPTGFYVKAFDNALEMGIQKSSTFGDTMLKLNVNMSIMSGFNFFNVNTFTFVFYNTKNHVSGDKINLKIYVNGSLRGSLDIADNVLTQEQRDAGVFYGTESHKLYLNRWMHMKASNCTFDNVRFLRRVMPGMV